MSVIPEQLRICFIDLDFIARIPVDHKVCFKRRYYVHKDEWIGAILRMWEYEKLTSSGISELQSLTRITSSLYDYYKNDQHYGQIFLDKIVDARKGLKRLCDTYRSIGKTVESDTIQNSVIMDFDILIPSERREIEGFSIPKSKEQSRLNTKPLFSQEASITNTIENEDITEL